MEENKRIIMDKPTPVNHHTHSKVYHPVSKHLRSRCLLCLGTASSQRICTHCSEDLPKPRPRCIICGEKKQKTDKCHNCLKKSGPISKTIIACEYRYPANRLLQEGKYHQNLLACHFMGELLASAVLASEVEVMPDIIIPVPLHHKRHRQRGYNQAEEIARAAAYVLDLVCDGSLTLRIKDTTSQTKLSKTKRVRNIKQAFTVRKKPLNKNVAIVDDVMTTGSTIVELAKVCREAGATDVQSWVFARRDLGV